MTAQPSSGGASIRSSWIPAHARRYRRHGGPWRVPTLDALLTGRAGELVDADRRWGPTAVEDLVARVAGGLAAMGARRGQPVTWQLANGINAALLFRACWRIGAVAVPLLASLQEADRRACLAQLPDVVELDLDGSESGDPEVLLERLPGEAVGPGATAGRPSDLATVLFTSGSTGNPKGVLHTHRALAFKAQLMAGVHGLTAADAVLVPAPMAHVAGLLNGILVPGAAGMRAIYMSRFDAEQANRLVERETVSFMAGPPTFFVAMSTAARASSKPASFASMRLISTGGASVTPAFVEEASGLFACRVKRTYGSTEAPTVTTSTGSDAPERARDFDGRAVGEVELCTVDPVTGRRTDAGVPGELWVRGPEMFAGYARPEENAAAIARGGWFRTGDLGTLDHQGWLTIVGRLKDVIIRGGENIAAAEVEAVLEAHPGIRQAVAVGYPDPLMGERVCAFVVSDSSFSLEDCRLWFVQRQVAKFKTPERVVRLPDLPKLGSGKVDRAALRRRATERERLPGGIA